jgi:hypothetical protein
LFLVIVPECGSSEKFRVNAGASSFQKKFPGTDPALKLKKLQTGFQNGKNMPI